MQVSTLPKPARPQRATVAAMPVSHPGRAAPQKQSGASAGVPLYLQTRYPVSQPGDAAEREADGMAQRALRLPLAAAAAQRPAGGEAVPCNGVPMIQRAAEAGSPAPATAHAPVGSGGSALSASLRSFMEPRFGADFSGVRIHTGRDAAHMNRALGARAFTVGQDVYFGSGASTANLELTAHELAHVVQQTSGVGTTSIQRAIDPSYTVGSGRFDVTAVPGGPNLPITIRFDPAVTAPYSNQIGLIQIVRLTDASGTNIEPQSLPAARGAALRTQTTDATGVDAGFFTDVLHNDAPAHGGVGTDAPAGSDLPPQYPFGNDPAQPNPATPGLSRPFSSGAGGAIVGYKRSDDPADIKAAELTDAPGYASAHPANTDINFDFETVAKGEDTMTIYGALKWGFQIRSSVATNEYASASGVESATFGAALERHRDFYVHEPVIFYFDFDSDVLSADEENKIDTFLAYLGRFPDVQVTPIGFADRRGAAAYNAALSLRRAQAVDTALRAKGVPASQISAIIMGAGATEDFTPDATTDQDLEANRRGNRRVVLSFEHVPAAGGAAGGTP